MVFSVRSRRSLLIPSWLAAVLILFTSLWRVINEIEGSKGLAPEEWVSCPITEERRRELDDVDILQKKLSKVRVEISHGKGILEGGLRLGRFCKEAIPAVYGGECLQGTLMGGGLMPGERELLVERMRGPVARCEAVLERFTELEARHNGHLGHVSGMKAAIRAGNTDWGYSRSTMSSRRWRAKPTGRLQKLPWMWPGLPRATAER
jgi:hypothetical protein